MACKEGQFDVVELVINDQFKTFSINLNAQHVNGMTPFDIAVHVRLLYTLEYCNLCMQQTFDLLLFVADVDCTT